VRLRPILMSNVAIAVALLPQAMGSGAGAAFRVPMAVVTIGGALVAAVFTLFLIPVIYVKVGGDGGSLEGALPGHGRPPHRRGRGGGALHPREGAVAAGGTTPRAVPPGPPGPRGGPRSGSRNRRP
jgi:hypothetical protein